jgi:hypothetical protein
MRTPHGLCLLLFLVTSACVLPAADDGELDAELEGQASALALAQVPRLQVPRETISAEIAEQFAAQLAELRCRENPSEAPAHFVVPRRFAIDLDGEGNYCPYVDGTNGGWYGEPAFPDVVAGLCRYVWEGSTAPNTLLLGLSAARQPFSFQPRMTADCRQVLRSCSSVRSCAAARPATRPTPAEVASHFTPEPLPCPACRGTVASRKLIAVLSSEYATHSLVRAEAVKDGVLYTTTFRPSGSQVDSYEIPDHFPDTTDVEFRPFYSARVVPAP